MLSSTAGEHSPFPRWFGYLNLWFLTIFELGAVAFNFGSGSFSWNGVFPFWIPFSLFGVWLLFTYVMQFRSLHAELRDLQDQVDTGPVAEPSSVAT